MIRATTSRFRHRGQAVAWSKKTMHSSSSSGSSDNGGPLLLMSLDLFDRVLHDRRTQQHQIHEETQCQQYQKQRSSSLVDSLRLYFLPSPKSLRSSNSHSLSCSLPSSLCRMHVDTLVLALSSAEVLEHCSNSLLWQMYCAAAQRRQVHRLPLSTVVEIVRRCCSNQEDIEMHTIKSGVERNGHSRRWGMMMTMESKERRILLSRQRATLHIHRTRALRVLRDVMEENSSLNMSSNVDENATRMLNVQISIIGALLESASLASDMDEWDGVWHSDQNDAWNHHRRQNQIYHSSLHAEYVKLIMDHLYIANQYCWIFMSRLHLPIELLRAHSEVKEMQWFLAFLETSLLLQSSPPSSLSLSSSSSFSSSPSSSSSSSSSSHPSSIVQHDNNGRPVFDDNFRSAKNHAESGGIGGSDSLTNSKHQSSPSKPGLMAANNVIMKLHQWILLCQQRQWQHAIELISSTDGLLPLDEFQRQIKSRTLLKGLVASCWKIVARILLKDVETTKNMQSNHQSPFHDHQDSTTHDVHDHDHDLLNNIAKKSLLSYSSFLSMMQGCCFSTSIFYGNAVATVVGSTVLLELAKSPTLVLLFVDDWLSGRIPPLSPHDFPEDVLHKIAASSLSYHKKNIRSTKDDDINSNNKNNSGNNNNSSGNNNNNNSGGDNNNNNSSGNSHNNNSSVHDDGGDSRSGGDGHRHQLPNYENDNNTVFESPQRILYEILEPLSHAFVENDKIRMMRRPRMMANTANESTKETIAKKETSINNKSDHDLSSRGPVALKLATRIIIFMDLSSISNKDSMVRNHHLLQKAMEQVRASREDWHHIMQELEQCGGYDDHGLQEEKEKDEQEQIVALDILDHQHVDFKELGDPVMLQEIEYEEREILFRTAGIGWLDVSGADMAMTGNVSFLRECLMAANHGEIHNYTNSNTHNSNSNSSSSSTNSNNISSSLKQKNSALLRLHHLKRLMRSCFETIDRLQQDDLFFRHAADAVRTIAASFIDVDQALEQLYLKDIISYLDSKILR